MRYHHLPLRRAVAAAALCVAGHASAQGAASDVNVYGRIDLNLTHIEGGPWRMDQAATSRIGLRGSEPLGATLKMQFQLEARVDADTGGAESRFWGRESWLGVQGDLGRLRLGRSQSPSQRLASHHDPHGTDGIGSFGSSGLLLGLSPLVRLDNAVFVETRAWRGLSAAAAWQLSEDAGPQARVRSVRLRYAAGAADLSAAAAAIGNGNRVNSFGAAWELGAFRPTLQWHWGRREGMERRVGLVGATVQQAPGSVRFAVSRQDERGTAARARRTLVALGYDHGLSRRTQLYGTVVRQHERAPADGARAGFEAGARHAF